MSNDENPIRDKSYAFALRIIKLSRLLSDDQKEYVLSRQIIKSGTSIGANIREALQAQSKKDFINKLSISLKEAHETDYWINLLRDSGYISKSESTSLLNECNELISLLTSIIKTTKNRSE